MSIQINDEDSEREKALSELVKSLATPIGVETNPEKPEENENNWTINVNSVSGGGKSSPSDTVDPNAIVVTIEDPKAPVVVFFGPPSCGKTMTLVRLTRYLKGNGYTIQPVKTFRKDATYVAICDGFNQLVDSDKAAEGTANIDFMLLRVLRNNKTVCQLLEAPGEYYYDPHDPRKEFPPYVHTIKNSPNRKLWMFFVEPDWNDPEARRGYVDRIHLFKQQTNSRDGALFIYNKVDLSPYTHGAGMANLRSVIDSVRNQYPGIFSPFKNENPLTKWIKPYRCDLVPFHTGNYTKTLAGDYTYTEGPDIYPRKLWAAMKRFLY